MERGLSGIRKYRAREKVSRSLQETTSNISISISIHISISISISVSISISIGNHMISSAIWSKSARVNFSKTNKSDL